MSYKLFNNERRKFEMTNEIHNLGEGFFITLKEDGTALIGNDREFHGVHLSKESMDKLKKILGVV